VNCELEKVWKEAVMAWFSSNITAFAGEPEESKESFSWDGSVDLVDGNETISLNRSHQRVCCSSPR
jgi:hypothetical protein